MNIHPRDHQVLRTPILVFFFFVVGILVLGFIYRSQVLSIIHKEQNELAALADLKGEQITRRQIERLIDAEFVYDNTLLVHQAHSYYTLPTDVNRKKNLFSISSALCGMGGIVKGRNHGGIPVFATIRQISDSLWSMVSQGAQEEVYTPIQYQAGVGISGTIILILSIGSIIGYWWRNQRVRFYRGQYDAELERLALIKHFEYLIKYANDIIILSSENYKIVEVNDRALEAYKYSRDEILRLTIDDLCLTHTNARMSEQIRNVTEEQGATFETIHKRKDGTAFPVELSVHLIKVEKNKFYQAIIRDITDRKYAEEALAKTQSILLAAIDQSPAGIMIADASSSKIRLVNKAAEEILLMSEDEQLRISLDNPDIITWQCFRPDGTPFAVDELPLPQTIITGTSCNNVEMRVRRHDGSERWILVNGSPIYGPERKIIGGLIVFPDITERKQADEELRENEKKYKSVIENIQDVFFRSDKDDRIIMGSPSGARMFGYTSVEEMHGLPLDSFWLNPRERERALSKMRESGLIHDYEAIFVKKDGTLFPVSMSAHLLYDETGTFQGTEGIIRDITERKHVMEALRESEEKFRTFAEQSPNMIFINHNGRIVYANAECEKLMGYTKEEFYSSSFNFLQITAPEYVELLKGSYARHLQGEDVPAYEYSLISKRGKRIDAIIHTKLIPYENEKAILGIITDITERKQIEEALRESEIRFRKMFDEAPVGYHELDAEGRFTRVNKTELEMLGYTAEEMIGQYAWKYVADEEMSRQRTLAKLAGTIPPSQGAERILQRKNQTAFPVVIEDRILRDVHGKITGIRTIIEDITERKRTEGKIQQSLSLLQATLESTADGILVVDYRGIITNYNAQFALMWNLPEYILAKGDEKQVINFVLAQLKNPEEYIAKVNALYSLPEADSFDFLEFKDGRIFERYSHPQRIEGHPIGRVWSFRDVTERKRAEEQLQESEERYRRLVEFSPDAIAVHSEGKFVYVNPSTVKLLGASDPSQLIGLPLLDIIHPDYREAVHQRVSAAMKDQKAMPSLEEKFIRFDGVVIDVAVTSLPIVYQGKPAIQVVARDITEQKKLQGQLLQSQKIQSIGTLAGGIAHDFNNILAIILGYSSMLERRKHDTRKHAEGVAAINQAVERGAALVRQILTFARKTDVSIQPLSIPDLFHELISMLKQTFPRTIIFTQTYSPDLPDILADRTQIHQAILNLCVNARDAMPNGGSITIKAEQWTKEQVHERFPTANQEMYVRICVSDTGVGMDEATYLRVFDPFFTTKEKGKGTGLGLSVVYGVTQSHHGFVDVESQVGQGTTFSLFLPVPHRMETNGEQELVLNEKPPGGTETILIVEDEFLILKTIRRLLKSNGYHLHVATDGEEALEKFKQHRHEIDLVFTDIGLPKMSGIDEFKKIREIDPNMKVILASGFFDPDLKIDLQQAGIQGFIQKPYTDNDVLRILREVLDKKKE
jgi:PAS domain S-box-containing protein